MMVPNEFKHLVGAFYQGSDREYPKRSDWIKSRIEYLNSKGRIVVRAYLDELLSGSHTDEQLQAASKEGNSCYFF